jgi:ATP-binding cassette, subfamily C, bacterial CydCD
VTHNPADIRAEDARLVLAPGTGEASEGDARSEHQGGHLVASLAGDQPSTS